MTGTTAPAGGVDRARIPPRPAHSTWKSLLRRWTLRTWAGSIGCIVGLTAVTGAFAGSVGAQVAAEPESTRTSAGSHGIVETAGRLANTLVRDGIEIVKAPARLRSDDIPALLGVSAALAVIARNDRRLRNWIGRSEWDFLGSEGDVWELLGRVQVVQLIGGGLYLAGDLVDSRRLARAGVLAWESSVFTVLVTGALKVAFGRRRPFEGRGATSFQPFRGGTSFPSSHASQAFALATVLSKEYGGFVSAGSYGIATLVALARMRGDFHWASDVAAGALLGTGVASLLYRLHSQATVGTTRPAIRVVALPERGGLLLRVYLAYR